MRIGLRHMQTARRWLHDQETHMRSLPAILFAVLLCFGTSVLAASLSVGITPLKSAAKLAEDWRPLIAEVGKRAGVELVFRTAANVPAFGERLAQGEYDIAYMNPYHYSLYSARPGYRAFAREQGRPLTGVIIVRKDSPLKSLADLANRTVIFPTPLAFAASLLTQAELQHQGIPIKPRYVQSHDSVLHGIANGSFDAGGTIAKILESADPAIASTLRILARTEQYQSHPFTAHPRVDPATLARIQAAFLSLQRDAAGRRLLHRVAFKGMELANDSDYGDIRRLDMSKLVDSVD
jgi:phosphonate transport system substrate-binding protein